MRSWFEWVHNLASAPFVAVNSRSPFEDHDGNVRRILFGCRETLGRADAIRTLRVDCEIALAVRLECEPLSVCRPHRHPVPAAEREPAQLTGTDRS